MAVATSKKPAIAKRRERTALLHRLVRLVVQIAFFTMAPAAFSGAFNGVKYVFAQVGIAEPLEVTSFVLLLLALLAFTVVFGRFFCGYACAFGTASDILYAAFEFVRSKTPIPRLKFPAPLVRALSAVKYVVLAAICAACFLGVWAAYSGLSPWVGFAGMLSGSLEGIRVAALVALGVVAVCSVVRERFFCQFLCPLGALFSFMPTLPFSEFTRTRAHCARSCGRCEDACPVGIWPDADTLEHGECIACGRCADSCPMANVNLLALEKPQARAARLEKEAQLAEKTQQDAGVASPSGARPLRKTRETWHLWRGAGVGYTLAKALALFVLLWAAGAVRYLPSFSEVVALLQGTV